MPGTITACFHGHVVYKPPRIIHYLWFSMGAEDGLSLCMKNSGSGK
jgi:hypothetical protein